VKADQIFAGLKRQRLPGMHMISALEGDVPLRDALASHFFVMMHDKIEHNCLITAADDAAKGLVNEAQRNAATPDSAILSTVFGQMGLMSLYGQEWSYLSLDEAFSFYLLADTAIEQTQRWINAGKQEPFSTGYGPLVERPAWTMRVSSEPSEKTRLYLNGVRAEIDSE
jgi:hypothetical protein